MLDNAICSDTNRPRKFGCGFRITLSAGEMNVVKLSERTILAGIANCARVAGVATAGAQISY